MEISRSSLLSCFLLFCMTSISWGGTDHGGEAHKTRLPMSALKAANIALLRFENEQPKVDPKGFYVLIEETTDSFVVDFVPNPVPIDEGHDGDKSYIKIQAGGANENGREIRYVVSKDSFHILKTIYPR